MTKQENVSKLKSEAIEPYHLNGDGKAQGSEVANTT